MQKKICLMMISLSCNLAVGTWKMRKQLSADGESIPSKTYVALSKSAFYSEL